MTTIRIRSLVGPDGTLDLRVPTGLPASEVDVLVVLQPLAGTRKEGVQGWPPGFIEDTAGGWHGEPLERAPQGDFETRDVLC